MNTSVSYLTKEIKHASDGKSTYCKIEAMLSLDNNPYMKAIVSAGLEPMENILKKRNAYQLNGCIYFTCNGYARLKDGDESNLVEARHIAEDKCQMKCILKAYKIYADLGQVAKSCEKTTVDRTASLGSTLSSMQDHIYELTKKK